MIFAGGLLRLYWDSGPPPAAGDGFPLGLENVARPNVHVRWGNKKPEPLPRPPAPKPPEVEREQEAVPVALPVRVGGAHAEPSAQRPATRTVELIARALPARASAQPRAPTAALLAVPQAAAICAHAAPAACRPQTLPEIDDRTAAAVKQRERNRKAIELALRLLDDE